MEKLTNKQLEAIAYKARYHCVDIVHNASSGHPGGSMSCLDVLTTLYFDVMNIDPEDPKNVEHIETGLAKVLTPEMQVHIKQFHLRGGIDYSRLNLVHKSMMAMLRRSMLTKEYDNLRDEDKLMLDTYGKKVDFLDRSTIAPLVDYVNTKRD